MMKRSEEAASLLRENAINFLNGGVELLYSSAATAQNAKLSIVLVQTAVELFVKHRVVSEHGFKSIVRKGNVPSSGSLLAAAKAGSFSTLNYGECLDLANGIEGTGAWGRQLMDDLRKTRNTLVHFAGDLEVEDARRSVSAVLVQALALFATGRARDEPEMRTYREFLDPNNFNMLVLHPEFVVEAYDAASNDSEADEVFHCWECSQETLTLRWTGTYFCWTCGLGAGGEVAGFAPCWRCSRLQSVVYDSLNETNGAHYGRCIPCGAEAYVANCSKCGKICSEAAPNLLEPCLC